jgi:hypothetical protein
MGKGQKSLSLAEELHGKLTASWQRNLSRLKKKYGVTTFTAYAQKLIERGLEEDLLESRFEIVSRFGGEVKVRDYFLQKDAFVRLNSEGPYSTVYCELDTTGNCPHVGFVLSDPGVVQAARDHGLVFRKSSKSIHVDEAWSLFERAIGKRVEMSDKEFIDKVVSWGKSNPAEAKEMLQTLYVDYRIVISHRQSGIFFFRKAV